MASIPDSFVGIITAGIPLAQSMPGDTDRPYDCLLVGCDAAAPFFRVDAGCAGPIFERPKAALNRESSKLETGKPQYLLVKC